MVREDVLPAQTLDFGEDRDGMIDVGWSRLGRLSHAAR